MIKYYECETGLKSSALGNINMIKYYECETGLRVQLWGT